MCKQLSMLVIISMLLVSVDLYAEYANENLNSIVHEQYLEPRMSQITGKWGFVDEQENVVIPIVYDEVYGFFDGLAAAKLDGKWGFIDKTGKVVIDFAYSSVHYRFDDGLVRVCAADTDMCGFIDKTGNVVVPFKYSFAFEFRYGLSMVGLNQKYGFVDVAGNEVVSVIYDEVVDFINFPYILVRQNKRWGSFDKTGNQIVAVKYSERKAVQRLQKHIDSK